MVASLRALLTGLIDYAGLFPPAGLPLDQAIRNYARYQQEPESWMLGSFVCPAKLLEELGPLLEILFNCWRPLDLTVLGPSASSQTESFLFGLVDSVEKARSFRDRWTETAVCVVLETRLPKEVGSLSTKQFDDFILYFEPTLGNDWQADVTGAITVIVTSSLGQDPWEVGFKLRCGGLEPSAFPTPEQVAFTIAACRDAKVPLKFTAGLHHPIRDFNAGVRTHMHGFVNVFVAGVLAHSRELSAEQLLPIIEDEDANNFHFDDDGVRWKDYRASTEEIVCARRDAVTSFGSCSFDEPRDDLRKLGWV